MTPEQREEMRLAYEGCTFGDRLPTAAYMTGAVLNQIQKTDVWDEEALYFADETGIYRVTPKDHVDG